MKTIKICGFQSSEEVAAVQSLAIDYIGFVFAKSKRQVLPSDAGRWLRELNGRGAGPKSVGVFVNPTMEQLQETLSEVPLDVIQLHGQESAAFCEEVKGAFPQQIIKVISVAKMDDASIEEIEIKLAGYAKLIDGLLLDTFDPVYGGGSGKTFRWELISHYAKWTRKYELPLWVAGGLNADNVLSLLNDYEVDGVDLSSGVEVDGRKSIEKIKDFVKRVRLDDEKSS